MAQTELPPITIRDAELAFLNFAGKPDTFNPQGKSQFCIMLPDDVASHMQRDGWNVKFLRAREEGDEPRPYISVEVSYKIRPPRIRTITPAGQTVLGQGEVALIDWMDIKKADVTINPSAWEVNGKTGIKAYLGALYLHIVMDELEAEYADIPIIGQGSSEHHDG